MNIQVLTVSYKKSLLIYNKAAVQQMLSTAYSAGVNQAELILHSDAYSVFWEP